MPEQEQGFQIDPQVLIQTQTNFIAQARTKEVQMEAAIQQLLAENSQLRDQVDSLERHNSEDVNAAPEAEQE